MPTPPNTRPAAIRLRLTTHADVDALFRIQLDPAGNQLAGTKPRDLAAFTARWAEILRDPPHAWPLGSPPRLHPSGVTPRVILADGELAGSINIVAQEGTDWIGYWLSREHWGRGIATRAIALMLEEFTPRPLSARVVPDNHASIRALERNGFKVAGRVDVPGDDRHAASERLVMTLGERIG